MNIQESNGKTIQRLLDRIGPDNASITTENDWILKIYYSEQTPDNMTIEMCLTTSYNGDPLFDPLMKIRLDLGGDGRILSATPLYYLSRTLFYNKEIYSEGNPSCYDPRLYDTEDELDSRLESWLKNLEIQGYLTKGEITLI